MFQFNFKKYDFWIIYESIRKYNPIGIEKDRYGFFDSFPGHKKLGEIINDNIHDEENFQTRWKNFEKQLKSKIKYPIEGTTYGQAPSFSSYVEIEKISNKGMTRLKELNFIVSLVGKYYTVVGQDRNETIIENRVYHSSNCMIVSPANDFSETFIILCEEIETSFKGYRFIPFCIYSQIIEGLNVRYTDEKLNTIYHALFNNHFKDLNISIIGDKDYKLEDWIFEDYIETIESWTIYPPNQDIE